MTRVDELVTDLKLLISEHYALGMEVEENRKLKEEIENIKVEIDTQEKWLLQAGYSAYNTDIAFNAIKRTMAESRDDSDNAPTVEIPEWTPVSEKLPEADEYIGDVAKYYLVQNEYGDMLVARYTHSGYWEQIYQLKPISDVIVAWMPLPEPYEPQDTVKKKAGTPVEGYESPYNCEDWIP